MSANRFTPGPLQEGLDKESFNSLNTTTQILGPVSPHKSVDTELGRVTPHTAISNHPDYIGFSPVGDLNVNGQSHMNIIIFWNDGNITGFDQAPVTVENLSSLAA